jgi:hypothetical protein
MIEVAVAADAALALLVGEDGEDGADVLEVVLPVPPHAASNNSMSMKAATIGKQNLRVGTATTICRYTPFFLESLKDSIANKQAYSE